MLTNQVPFILKSESRQQQEVLVKGQLSTDKSQKNTHPDLRLPALAIGFADPYFITENKYMKYTWYIHVSVAISSYLPWFYDSTYMYGHTDEDVIKATVCNFNKLLMSTPGSNSHLHILPLKWVET